MTGELDEYPECFADDERLPWEPGYVPIITVPFPNMKSYGKPLQSLTSPQLLAVRAEAIRRCGVRGAYFIPLVEKCDEILMGRGGE